MDAEYRDPKVRELLRRIDRRRGFNTSDAALDDPRLDDPGIVTQLPQHFAGRLVPEGYLGLYCESDFGDRPDVREVDRDVVRAMQREYSAMTTSIDDEMGRLLNALEERGLRENTIVIFTADHGDHLGAHGNRRGKATPLQSAWRTPLIVSGPGVSFGETSDVLVSGVDLLPTICGLAGVRSHDGLPGHDVSAVAQDSVLSGLGRWRALVTKKWCLAVEFPEDGRPVCRSLVDLENDPYDLHDLQHELPEVRHKLHDQLMERLRGTDDPLAPQN
jgi:arylsulfatase A-like enzyme